MTHGEAFALMKYQTEDQTVVEYIWNSRDGVTPFGVQTRDGKDTLFHVEWQRDQRREYHVPQIGDRVFVDATKADVRGWITERVDQYWERPEYPMKDAFGSKQDAIEQLFESEWREGAPNLITVTEWPIVPTEPDPDDATGCGDDQRFSRAEVNKIREVLGGTAWAQHVSVIDDEMAVAMRGAPTLRGNWRERLRALPEGWDSDNAPSISEKAISTLDSFAVVPCSDGGIQLEVHHSGLDIEIIIGPSGAINIESSIEVVMGDIAGAHTSLTGAELAGETRTLTDQTGRASSARSVELERVLKVARHNAGHEQDASRAPVNSILGDIAGAGNAAPDSSGLQPGDAPPPETRDERQKRVHDWCAAAFGLNHALSVRQRGIRLAEEAIEAAQAANCDPAMVHKLVDHVFSKDPGSLRQEIGGVGITILALAEACGASAEAEEIRELRRVLAKPLEHFAARNKAKNDAGFDVEAPPVTAPPPATCNVQFATLPHAIRCQLPLGHPRPVRADGVPCHAGQDRSGRIVVFGEGQAEAEPQDYDPTDHFEPPTVGNEVI